MAVATAQDRPEPPPTAPLGVFFWHDSPNDEAAFAGLRAGLEAAGPMPELLVRRAGADRDAAQRILAEFRTRRVAMVVAMGTQAALLAAAGEHRVPIVFTAVTNPVESGLVASWHGSRRNLAGNSNWIAPDAVLRVFHLAVPQLTKLGMIRSSAGVVSAAELQAMRQHLATQPAPRLEIVDATVDDAAALGGAVDRLAGRGVQAIWIPIDQLVYDNTPFLLAAAARHRIPLLASSLRGARAGAVAGVVVDYVMLGKQAALMARDILRRDADPGAMPVGTMAGHRVVVNLEAARRCGYELPLRLLVVADDLIERTGAQPGGTSDGR